MLDLLEKALKDKGLLSGELPPIITELTKSVDNYNVPSRFKISVAVAEFILFFSQFRRNIQLWNGGEIPVNHLTFGISESGSGKGHAVKAIRSCFADSYKSLNDYRKTLAIEKAKKLAAEDGVEDPMTFPDYEPYYSHPDPLFAAPNSTLEGLIKTFNGFEEDGIAAGAIESGELGDEMARGIADLMQFMAEVYDTGDKEVKALANKANQLKPLENFPVSANFMGSQAALLQDNVVRSLFIKAFSSKLARRSFFMYAPEKVVKPTFKSLTEFDAWIIKSQEKAKESSDEVSEYLISITPWLLETSGTPIQVSEEVTKIYSRYKAYNEELSAIEDPQYPISKLARAHMQWKSLKFAGAIALSKCKDIIELEDFTEAVTYSEMLSNDIREFEKELAKEAYEVFVDYMHSIAVNNTSHISLHNLRKLGFISTAGKVQDRMKELINLASSYDSKGIYTITDDGINYECQILTDTIGVSYLEVAGTKDQRARQCANGFEYTTCTFEDLSDMLSQDLAYSPFEFEGGIRGKDNITSGCKWVVLDIDESNITDEECHFMLSHINHHIARTSDGDNPFKFRVLIELDAMVDIDNQHWKAFIQSITTDLALIADPLGKAQIFFSYADRPILSVTDGAPLATKDHIIASNQTEVASVKTLKPTERATALKNPHSTFEYAFEASSGSRSVSLIRAAYHAKDLGAEKEQIIALVHQINNYWLDPLDEDEIKRTIVSQISRW